MGVKNSFYPDLYFWSHNLPRTIRTSIYKKYGLNIRFEIIPEKWPPMLYFWYFGKYKDYHYPTDDDIKFFYFTLFKKNGFLFIIFFYLIVYFIYLILFLRKILRLSIKMLYLTPVNCIPTLFLIFINCILNIFNSKKKKKWYF